MSSNVRRQQADGPERPDQQPGHGLSARDAAVARKVQGGNAGYVVQHSLVHTPMTGWQERRVVTPEDLVDADLDDSQVARLDRLGAWRPATSEELSDAADAKKAAEDAGVEFTGYYVPAEPPPEATPQSAVVGERA